MLDKKYQTKQNMYLNLYPNGYREREIDLINKALKIRSKIFFYYLYGVGRNNFFQYIDHYFRKQSVKLISINVPTKAVNEIVDEICLSLNISSIITSPISLNELVVLNIQFDHIFEEKNKELLDLISRLRDSNPANVITIIHSFWIHGIEECISKSNNQTLFNGFIEYFPPADKNRFDDELFYFEKKNKVRLNQKERDAFWKLSGGIPYIYKQAYLFSIKNGIHILSPRFLKEFINSMNLKIYFSHLLKDLGPECSNILISIAKEEVENSDNLECIYTLSNLGIIEKTGEIKSEVLKNLFIKESLQIQSKVDSSEERREEIFSDSEQKIIDFVKKNSGKISREEIARVLWGNEYIDRYSDFAIDKHISNIRNKFQIFELGKIKTIKKQGYVFEN